jgi:hypothetical protein
MNPYPDKKKKNALRKKLALYKLDKKHNSEITAEFCTLHWGCT